MAVVRIIALVCAVLFVGLLVCRQQLSARAQRLEAAWAQAVTGPTPARSDILRRDLARQGCVLSSQGSLTQVSFEGSHDTGVALVNRLLSEPYAWAGWSGEKTSPAKIKSIILLQAL